MTTAANIITATEDARFSRDGPVAILTLNRPQKLNALTLAMHQAIFQVLRRLLVLRGEWFFANGARS